MKKVERFSWLIVVVFAVLGARLTIDVATIATLWANSSNYLVATAGFLALMCLWAVFILFIGIGVLLRVLLLEVIGPSHVVISEEAVRREITKSHSATPPSIDIAKRMLDNHAKATGREPLSPLPNDPYKEYAATKGFIDPDLERRAKRVQKENLFVDRSRV